MRHTGHAPFGFEWKDDKLLIVEDDARIRRLAFALYAELRNKAAVAKRLNELGHRSRRNYEWRDVTVARLLSCSSAHGLYAVNKTVLDSAGKRVERPQDEWEFIHCPPLVSDDLWREIQAALAEDVPPAPSNANPSNTFTGILFCRCGGRMNAATSSPKYVCARCGNRLPISDLENAFLDEVASFLGMRKSTSAEIITGDSDLSAQRQLFQRTQDKGRQIDEEISKTERLYLDSRISVERFEKIHRPLEDERRAIQRELGRSKARLSRLEAKQSTAPSNTPFDPTVLRHRWPQMPADERRNIVRLFVGRIVVADDEIEFSYRFRDPSERTTKGQHSHRPTNSESPGESATEEPLYVRLPKPGQLCSRTGMTRSTLNELILPTERNSYRPPVESKCLRKQEGGKGTRLIVWQSLKDYLARQR